MVQKEMMVFYVANEPDSGRMGTTSSYFVGFYGNDAYTSSMPDVPKTFEAMIEFLKSNNVTMTHAPASLFFFDVIMQSAKNRAKSIKNITDFKFGDSAYLGMGNFGYSLGQLTVNVKVDDE
jgi:hypothetical protein